MKTGAVTKPVITKEKRSYVRADSLDRMLGDDNKRRAVCDWLFAQGINPTQCARQIEQDLGVVTTSKAVKFFARQYAFTWKIGGAKSQAEIEKDLLPSNWEARIREALAQRRFEAAFKELSEQQIIAFEKLDLEKRKVDLKSTEVLIAERRLILLEKKMEKAQETLEDGTIPLEEQARRIRSILGRA
jgi:hypothetical protein